MQAQRQEYPPYTTLKSSSDLGWSALVAELRSYRRSEAPGPAVPQAKIAIVGLAVQKAPRPTKSEVIGGLRGQRLASSG